jgi:hypothetical protein
LLRRIDVGIAVDLEGGLIVPVLRNVGERDSADLRAGLDRMRADAAARSIPPEELRGATITLSNFGMIAGRFASLVVVPPQVAIIGAGRAERRVVVEEGAQSDSPSVAVVADLRSPRRDWRRSRTLSRRAQIEPCQPLRPDLQLSVGSATIVGVMLPIIFLVKKTTLAAQSRH